MKSLAHSELEAVLQEVLEAVEVPDLSPPAPLALQCCPPPEHAQLPQLLHCHVMYMEGKQW